MSDFIEVKTQDLIGSALDWAVAQLEELPAMIYPCVPPYIYIDLPGRGCGPYHPSYNWSDGGPLIEKHQIELKWDGVDGKALWWKAEHQDIAQFQMGDTPLIAACRAIVWSKLGDTVQVPAELVKP